MASVLPQPLEELIEALGQLPGVGPRTAERYAYFLLRADPAKSKNIADKIDSIQTRIKHCPKTYALISADLDISPLYSNPARDKKQVAVVADPFDVVAIEKTNVFKGTYHVLGGLVSPIDGIGPEQLHIAELIQRIEEDKVTELILATNASIEGESTALLITQAIGDRNLRLTRLARGIPVGIDLGYTDQITLSQALEGRQTL